MIFSLDDDWSRNTCSLESHLKVHPRHYRTAEEISDVGVKFNFNPIYNKMQTWKTTLRLSITIIFFMLETSNMLDFKEIHWNMRKSTSQEYWENNNMIFLQMGITRGSKRWRHHNRNNSIFQRSERSYLWLQSSSTSAQLQLSTK